MRRLVRDLIICSKPGLSMMVVATFFIGALLGLSSQTPCILEIAITSLGLVFLVAGANVANCYLERDVDPYMSRTKYRPLVTGTMTPEEALGGAFLFSGLGLYLIWHFSNSLTFALGLLALVSYVLLYTPLKRKSTISLFVGAVPGALPPVMGWTALRGELSLTAIILFWILFLWQLPHFLSIAIYRREEYERAGLKTLAIQKGTLSAKWHMFLYSSLLVVVSFLPYFLDLAGLIYMGSALMMGLAFVGFAFESLFAVNGPSTFRLDPTRKVFFASLVYLPLTLGAWALEALLRSFWT